MKSGIDWNTRPAPWCWIGPQFRKECIDIVNNNIFVIGIHSSSYLIQRRKNANITQKYLAKLIGCHETHIYHIESGISGASTQMWKKIDGALEYIEKKNKVT